MGTDLQIETIKDVARKPAGIEVFRSAVRREMRSIFIVSAFVNVLLLTSSIYMLQVLDRVLSSSSLETLFFLTLIAVVAIAVYGLLEAARRQILSRIGAYCDIELMPQLLDQMILKRADGDRKSSRALADLTSIRGFLAGENILAFIDAPWIPIFLAVIALIHPTLGMVALAGVVILFIVTLINDQVSRPLSLKDKLDNNRTMERARNALRSSETVTALHIRAAIVDQTRRETDDRHARHQGSHDAVASIMGASRFLRFTLQIAILGVGAWLAILGQLTPGGMIAASILLSRAVAPVERSMSAWQSMILARQGWRNIKEIMSKNSSADDRMLLPDPRGELSFVDLTLSPKDSEQVLFEGINGVLAPGEILVVTGSSGSGKSSLARAIIGSNAPVSGSVSLDGVDVRQWRPAQLARWLGYLPQSVDLISGTIAQNISRFAQDADENAVVEAARLADVHDFIGSLDAGYNTLIGENGRQLSGGQAQRIALARAFYNRPRLVVLDEPTSGQDEAGTKAIAKALAGFRSAQSSVVIITHDQNLISLADKALFIGNGRARFSEVVKQEHLIEGSASQLSERIAQFKKRRIGSDNQTSSTEGE